MRRFLPEHLLKLADVCHDSLYIIGGSVRDFLCGYPLDQTDWDICSPCDEETLLSAAEVCGFTVNAVYRNTGTIKLKDANGVGYEFTRFRSDRYVRGVHTPSEITFTRDILCDARRRDFCANAVYYDVKRDEFCDPLGGIPDIERRIFRTVAPAQKVFGEDGLRLMRLARLAAQTGFSPDEECAAGAKANCRLIRDIAPERIFNELCLLLTADKKHGIRKGPYLGLKILHETGVLGEILPELALGDKMTQRSDFHDHDVLEHSFRCVLYAPPAIRFAALLHDVGKPFCYLRDGNFHMHPQEGAKLAREILTRLKAPKKLTEETEALVLYHMRDYNLQMKESKIRKEIIALYPWLEKLLALKQADYSACKDDLSVAPVLVKWRNVLNRMRQEGAPCTLGELAVNGKDLQQAGVEAQNTAFVLRELLQFCAQNGALNQKRFLLQYAKKHYTEEN